MLSSFMEKTKNTKFMCVAALQVFQQKRCALQHVFQRPDVVSVPHPCLRHIFGPALLHVMLSSFVERTKNTKFMCVAALQVFQQKRCALQHVFQRPDVVSVPHPCLRHIFWTSLVTCDAFMFRGENKKHKVHVCCAFAGLPTKALCFAACIPEARCSVSPSSLWALGLRPAVG